MVLVGQVNRDVVGLLNRHGPFAVGMSGEDAHLFTAERKQRRWSTASPVDIGQVGEIVKVEPGAVQALLDDGRIPVISSVARGDDGEVYNVNADTAAAALAVALERGEAGRPHRRRGPVRRLARQRPNVIDQLTADGAGAAAARACPAAWCPRWRPACARSSGGVPQAHVLDGRVPHSLLLEIFTDEGIGTWCCPS